MQNPLKATSVKNMISLQTVYNTQIIFLQNLTHTLKYLV